MFFGLFNRKNYNKFKENELDDDNRFFYDIDYINYKNGVSNSSNGWTHGIGIIIDKSFKIIGILQNSQIINTDIGINDELIIIDYIPINSINNIQYLLKGEPNIKIKLEVKKSNDRVVSCMIKRNIDSRKTYKIKEVIYDKHQDDIIKKLFTSKKY